MRTFFTLALAVTTLCIHAQTITTLNEFVFSPDLVTIEPGGSVTFNVTGAHTATQVSEATWEANDNTPLEGGFHFTSGTHIYTPEGLDTIYFVCQPHASMGMKGRIIVESTMNIAGLEAVPVRLYPNPASTELIAETTGSNELVLIDIQGREVLRRTLNGNERIAISHIVEGNYSAIVKDMNGNTLSTRRLTIAR